MLRFFCFNKTEEAITKMRQIASSRSPLSSLSTCVLRLFRLSLHSIARFGTKEVLGGGERPQGITVDHRNTRTLDDIEGNVYLAVIGDG